jgi:hypothetical protein
MQIGGWNRPEMFNVKNIAIKAALVQYPW